MEPLLTFLAKSLVEKPDQVEVRVSVSEGVRLFELKVAPEDVGKVIGRDGRTVNAIRTVLAAAAQKSGERVRLEILDDRRTEKLKAAPEARPTTSEGAPPPSQAAEPAEPA